MDSIIDAPPKPLELTVNAPEALPVESTVDVLEALPTEALPIEALPVDTNESVIPVELTVNAFTAASSEDNGEIDTPEAPPVESTVDAFTADYRRFCSSSTLASTLASTSTSASLTTDKPGKPTHEVNSLCKVNSLYEVNGLHEYTAIGRGGVG